MASPNKIKNTGGSKGPPAVLVIGGTYSGVGKTTITCGLMAALTLRGYVVQPFKVGPDFLDGMHHEASISSVSVLDSKQEKNKEKQEEYEDVRGDTDHDGLDDETSMKANDDDVKMTGKDLAEEHQQKSLTTQQSTTFHFKNKSSNPPQTQSQSQLQPRKSINLDGWLMNGKKSVLSSFHRHALGADVCIIEGVMGLHDGRDGTSDEGSTAQLAKILQAPVVLVLDASSMARSVAAMALGYARFDSELRVGAVVANFVGGVSHKAWIREAVEGDARLQDMGTGKSIRFVGGLPKDASCAVPERQLGLVPPPSLTENDKGTKVKNRFLRLASLVEENLNIDALLELGRSSTVPSPPKPSKNYPLLVSQGMKPKCRIGIAQDEAFCFYYQDNFHHLRQAGAQLCFFSPLHDSHLPPSLHALYIGGGYPEWYAQALETNASLRSEILQFAELGGVIWAECGGLMYLTEALWVPSSMTARANEIKTSLPEVRDEEQHKASWKRFKMCGVFKEKVARMTPHVKMHYATVTMLGQDSSGGGLFPPGATCRGQMFHFSEVVDISNIESDSAVERGALKSGEKSNGSDKLPTKTASVTTNAPFSVLPQTPGANPEENGFTYRNVVASYYHLHLASFHNPHACAKAVAYFVERSSKLRPLTPSSSSSSSFRSSTCLPPPKTTSFPRVVSFVSTATEIVLALGADEALVGITSLCHVPLEKKKGAKSISSPRVVCHSCMDASSMSSEEVTAAMKDLKRRKEHQDGEKNSNSSSPPGLWVVDRQALQELSPQVVFVQNTCDVCDPGEDDVLSALRDVGLMSINDSSESNCAPSDNKNNSHGAGCVVVGVAPKTLEGMLSAIGTISAKLRIPERGDAFVKSLRSRLLRVTSELSSSTTTERTRPRVLSLEGLAPLCTGGHWLPDVKSAAGCQDAFGDTGGAPARIITWENVTRADPDVLIVSPCSADTSRTLREMHLLASAPEFWKLRCVQKGEVYVLDHERFSKPGPRLVEGVELLATLLCGVPPPLVRSKSWVGEREALKYECSTEVGGSARHCTTELSQRFKPCFSEDAAIDLDQDCNVPNTIKPGATLRTGLYRINVTRCTLPAKPLPSRRSAHCLLPLRSTKGANTSVLLLTGEDEDGTRLSDVWKLCAPSDGWLQETLDMYKTKNPSMSPCIGPSPTWEYLRCGHVAGEDVPTPRSNAAAVSCGDYLLLFGGWARDNMTPLAHAELLHLETHCWTHASTRSGAKPSPRGNPSLVYSSRHHRVLLYGGWDGVKRLNDLWFLDMHTWVWTEVNSSYGAKTEQSRNNSCWPAARNDHSAVLWEKNETEEIMLVFGGSVDGVGTCSELWALHCPHAADKVGSRWTWQRIASEVAGEDLPAPRTSHCAALVGTGEHARMVVVGGTDSNKGCGKGAILCDAWSLQLGTELEAKWTKLAWEGDPIRRCRHGMAPVANDAVLIWGGFNGGEVVDEDASCWLGILPEGQGDGGMERTGASPPYGNDVEKERRHLQDRWDAEVPVRVTDLLPAELDKAKRSKLPGALVKALHRHAVSKNRDTYIDPESGYSVFTHVYLKKRPCCGNGCRHCPHGHVNVPSGKSIKSAVQNNLDW